MKKIRITRLQKGFCPCCNRHTLFISNDYWLRDHYHCLLCHSIPRQRAFMKTLQNIEPNYKKLKLHESSPSGPNFYYLRKECLDYTFSYYYKEKPLGMLLEEGGTNQNLEQLTFEDETFDIFLTQDVMEHVANPIAAFQNIERVLKTGGLHLFTVPLYPFMKTRARVELSEGGVNAILPEVYHGNPIDKKGALVTYDWGGDIIDFINRYTKMETQIIEFRNSEQNIKCGLEGDFLQILISRKR